ncbi:hypothetical protein BASA62_004340 [Batrachochytrium salamandrivorans]|nr:hypothetical protein BASA62_004340 [Batrachochytrium salamandrivorans]
MLARARYCRFPPYVSTHQKAPLYLPPAFVGMAPMIYTVRNTHTYLFSIRPLDMYLADTRFVHPFILPTQFATPSPRGTRTMCSKPSNPISMMKINLKFCAS